MITRRNFLWWTSSVLILVPSCTYRKHVSLKYDTPEAFGESIEELKKDGMKQVTTGFVALSAYGLLVGTLKDDGFRRAKIEDLISHARQVAKNSRAILSEHFKLVDSVPYEQQLEQLPHGTLMVNWKQLKHNRDHVLSSLDKNWSEKVIIVMKEIFANDYRLIDAS